MDFYTYQYPAIPAKVKVSHFSGKNGVDEYHLVVQTDEYADFAAQLNRLFSAYQDTLGTLGLDMQTVILRRFFCSDLLNQAAALAQMPFSHPQNPDEPCAISWICQPPEPTSKIALWAYHIKDSYKKLNKQQKGHSLTLERAGLSHIWTTGVICRDSDLPYEQTRGILRQYSQFLQGKKLSLADNLIRTWFFVQNIDADYQGLVNARRELFAAYGLTPDTHFVASTGVEGGHPDIKVKVSMDAYSISGLLREQVQFLTAQDHMSPAYLYGVTFERGTAVAYRDRKHVIISGTASIDHQGEILHPGNLSGQIDRTIENMEALLRQAGAALRDMGMLIAYVRDPADFHPVKQQMRHYFGDTPVQVVWARVCRPGWLIEIEGIAIISESNLQFPEF